jgi:hypothetical protein
LSFTTGVRLEPSPAGWGSSIEVAPRERFEMIDIDSLRRPDMIELCLIALFVIVVSIEAFVGMGR